MTGAGVSRLAELLRSLFTDAERKGLLRRFHHGARVARALDPHLDPWLATAYALRDHGMVDHALFDFLVEIRPVGASVVERARREVLGSSAPTGSD